MLLVAGFFIISANLRSKTDLPAITMTVWGTDQRGHIDPLIAAYKSARPNATVTYEQIDEAGYEEKVLNALASGNGPDVFMIGAHMVPKEKGKLVAVGAEVFGLNKLQQLFPTVVEQDFVVGGEIYALPLYSDTLALLYNKDFFDAAGIVEPPATWSAFQENVAKLRQLNANGQVTRAGAALGGSLRSVPNAADIVYALMLQKGTQMTNSALSGATFSSQTGVDAFNFYLRFADAASSYYTWSDTMPSAVDSMASGKSAMMIGYQSDYVALKKRSPFLNIGIAPLPQLDGSSQPVTYADYKGFAVSKQSKVSGWGWDFVVFVTTDEATHEAYLAATGRAPILRSVIKDKLDDVTLGVFAQQALTARSWYQADAVKIADAFDRAIRNVLLGSLTADRALRQAQETVSQLLR